ncbi:MAG: MarR family transcriptional regulator [Alphaproteobacteria bacterium]|nr:MarR family transcriptional regulator [Alphaproteobacteria bacterium]
MSKSLSKKMPDKAPKEPKRRRDEADRTSPFEVGDLCLFLHAQRAARALARQFDEALRPTGLTNGQFSLLMAINRPEPPRMRPVAELLAMDRTTLTAALKPLERRGLLAIESDAVDRRSRRLRLTAAGKALLSQALPIWRHVHAGIDARLTGFDLDQLKASLRALA